MKSLITLLFALAVMILAPTANAQTIALAAGNAIQIELKVPAEDAANVTSMYSLSATGTVRLPYLNTEILAVGLSPTALARKIEQAYKAAEIYTNPTINVIPAIGTGGQLNNIVIVGGEVKTGGREVPLRDGMRLYAAITSAGGFTDFADIRRVKIIRGTRSLIYDMRKIQEDGSNNPVLQPNDQIIVPSD